MARIRTIKPEFPQSETIGRLSRDARLLFIQLWTIADDEGRSRGNSRMLASLLYPYDDDAPGLIEGWLEELEREECIIRYEAEGSTYLQITNWLKHQRVDRPSKSKFPPPPECSRAFANVREGSCLDQGPRTKDQDQDNSSLRSELSASADATNGSGKPGCDLLALSPPEPDIPTAMVEIWRTELGDLLPRPRKIDQNRRAKLARRLREDFGNDLSQWRRYCQTIRGSPHLTGDNDRGWRADLDWCLEPRNVNRILEGRYAGKRRETTDERVQRLVAEHAKRHSLA